MESEKLRLLLFLTSFFFNCSNLFFLSPQVLLAMRANTEDRGAKGDVTALMEAASSGHIDIVKLLINHGAEINSQSSSGNLRRKINRFHLHGYYCLTQVRV